jgi:serine/threonine protein phosphatase 1
MTWLIGDTHGMYYTLVKLLDRIYDLDDKPQLVFVGDYIDRGGQSPKALDLVIELQSKGAVCLRGNHDDVVDWFLNGHTLSNLNEFTTNTAYDHAVLWWYENGFAPTVISYGVNPGQRGSNVVEQLRKQVPDSHKTFLKNLPLYWENDTHFACHGYMFPDRQLPREVMNPRINSWACYDGSIASHD